MRFLWSFFLVVLVCCSSPQDRKASAPATQIASKPDAKARFSLLQINDADTLYPGLHASHSKIPRAVTVVESIRQKEKHVLFIHAGDMLSPAVDSTLFRGRNMIEAMNAAQLDLAVIGNHELDFGVEVLKRRLVESKFPWMSANIIDQRSGALLEGILPNKIVEMDGIRVGFFALTTLETKLLPHLETVDFLDPIAVAKTQIAALKEQGAEVIIALTHQRLEKDRELAHTCPEIVHIAGGHDHDLMVHFANRSTIVKAGSHAEQLARIDFTFIRKAGRISVDRTVEIIPVTDQTEPHKAVQAVTERYVTDLKKQMSEVVGETSVPLDALTAHVRNQETNLANFFADVAREAMDADVALLNAGSVRLNHVIEPGPITRGTIVSLLPFEGHLVKIEMTGKRLLEALEYGVGQIGRSYGRFPQLSGVTMKVRTTESSGPRVSKVRVGGRALDLTATYTVAINHFIYSGGDGYTAFQEAKVLVSVANAPLLKNAIFNHLKQHKKIAPKVDGRITRDETVVRTPARRVIIDVDPSIDSAIAMLLVLRTTGVAAHAVTIVQGMSEVDIGGRNAQSILELAGKPDIPIHLGRSSVTEGGHQFPAMWKTEAANMGGVDLPPPTREPAKKRAARAIVDLANAHPGEITVVALGPLTNLYDAWKIDNSVATKIKSVVAMGGALRVRGNVDRPFVGYRNAVSEWNLFADPTAAARVVRSFDHVVFVALDAVERTPVTESFLDRLAQVAVSPLPRFAFQVLDAERRTIRANNYFFWDMLTVAAAVNPSLLKCEMQRVKIHTKPESIAGWTEAVSSGGRSVEVCVDADRKALEDFFLRVVRP